MNVSSDSLFTFHTILITTMCSPLFHIISRHGQYKNLKNVVIYCDLKLRQALTLLEVGLRTAEETPVGGC